jgi:hypothetical protein
MKFPTSTGVNWIGAKSLDPWRAILTDESGDIVWPQPDYGHAFYQEVPSWIHYGDNGTRRLLFDGAFIGADGPSARAGDPLQMLEVATMMQPYVYTGHYMGAEVPSSSIVPGGSGPRRGLLAEVAPHVAPATGPISVKKVFDDRQILHVEVCVDGKCYRTTMNLAPALTMVMEKLAQWHKDQHAAMVQHAAPDPQHPATTDVVGAIEGAIDAAGDAMADTLVCHHVNVMTGGFFDDIGSALGGTLRSLAPVISNVATGVAASYGGPAAGAAAGQLVPVMTNLQANLLDPKGDPKKKIAAQQALQHVHQVAQADPHAAQALATANKAVRDTALAYHVKGVVDKAVAGDPIAWNNVVAIVQAAERGDPAAKSTYEVIAQTLLDKAQHSEWGSQLWERIMGRGAGTTVGIWPGYWLAAILGVGAGAWSSYVGINARREQYEADELSAKKALLQRDQEWRDVADQKDQQWRAAYERVLRALVQVSPSAFEDYIAQRHQEDQGAVTASAGWYSSPVVGSFWDDVGSAITSAVMPAVTGTKLANQFVHDHGLEPYVKLAAQGVATAYGGPAAGAAASALAPSLMNLGVEDKSKAAAAQQDVQGVTAMAQQHSPQMAQAVDVAKGSIRGVATAYHIDHLLKIAKRGDSRAQRALARLRALAAAGNPSAVKALQAVNVIHQEQQRTAVSGWYDVVGAVIRAGEGVCG